MTNSAVTMILRSSPWIAPRSLGAWTSRPSRPITAPSGIEIGPNEMVDSVVTAERKTLAASSS
jgi:hypothetical protein